MDFIFSKKAERKAIGALLVGLQVLVSATMAYRLSQFLRPA